MSEFIFSSALNVQPNNIFKVQSRGHKYVITVIYFSSVLTDFVHIPISPPSDIKLS